MWYNIQKENGKTMHLILASNSPRRKQILADFGYEFSITVSDFCEKDSANDCVLTAELNALGKAKEVYNRLNDKQAVVLGADTVVCFNGEILGKPTSSNDAKNMLKKLSGKTHVVVTGYAIVCDGEIIVDNVKSSVTFNQLDKKLISDYVASGLPLDKAGAYGIQDGFGIVKECIGSLNNVIGLPIEQIKQRLDKLLK